MSDTFLFLAEIYEQFGLKTVHHLRQVCEAQHGVFKKQRFSAAALASYPKFTKGPGGRWGIFRSQLDAYWAALRRKNEVVVEASERFRPRTRPRRSA